MQNCHLIDLGLRDYKETWDHQIALFQEKIDAKLLGQKPVHHLLMVEHPHVYTFGKSAEKNNLLATPEMLKSVGASVYEIERGGDITYHGPGQLVVYPIFDLEQLHLGVKGYVNAVEKCIIQTIKHYGIDGTVIEDRIGVWLDKDNTNERKIAAIGIKCSRFVSMHGLALNVNTELEMFNHIVPCGIPDKQVTSIEKETGKKTDMKEVKSIIGKQFAHIFGLKYTS